MVSTNDQNQVILLPALCEVILGVVENMIGADGANQIHLRRATYTGHLSAERLGDLHGEQPHASRSSDDQDLVACLDATPVAKRLQSGDGRGGYGRRLPEAEIPRLPRK